MGGGGGDEVRIIADSFHWHHGQKLIIKHSVNLGLKNHIIYCGNLSEKYGAIVVLEDDSFVSPLFYQYAVSSCNYYNEDDNICGIALYSYRMNEIADCAPFVPYDNGYDAFFMQVPCSLGQVWTYEQWKPFRQFVELGLNDLSSLKMPLEVKTWPGSSWKRLMFAYMCIHNKFFVYPYRSFTTNFGDSGTHLAYNSTAWQSELCIIEKSQFRFQKLSKSALIYDAWMEITPTFLVNRGVKIQDDTCIDLYGTKELNFFNDCPFWLTRKKSSNFIRRYGLFSFPIENNIILSFPGTDISYSCYNTLS